METPTDLTLPEPGTAWHEFDEDSPLPPRKPKAFTRTSLVLSFVLVLGVGFAMGARVQKSQAPAAAANAGAGLTSNRAGRTGTGTGATAGTGSGAGAGFGAGAGNTIGSVKLVDGASVYIQTTAGDVIKVTPGTGAPVLVSKAGTVADLKPGDTIIVQGAADADGSIAATSITSTNGLSVRGAGGGAGNTGTAGGTATTTRG